MKVLLALIVCAAILPFSSSCIGRKVDDLALFKPAAAAWSGGEEDPNGIKQDFERGLADGVEDGELAPDSAAILRMEGEGLGVALDNQDRAALRGIPWPTMREWAARGIEDKAQDGEIGPQVADILHGRLDDFSNVLQRIMSRL